MNTTKLFSFVLVGALGFTGCSTKNPNDATKELEKIKADIDAKNKDDIQLTPEIRAKIAKLARQTLF
ncbi:MAG: hypothetical protein AABY64_10360 [Bdellovibrionota bacterium]|mgnify:CR=1 FL=1